MAMRSHRQQDCNPDMTEPHVWYVMSFVFIFCLYRYLPVNKYNNFFYHFAILCNYFVCFMFLQLVEIAISMAALISNCVVTVITYRAHPIPHAQKQFLAAQTVNYALLAGFQLSRNIFLFILLYYPCLGLVNSVSCKLQEFPVLFFYVHAAVLAFIVAMQTLWNFKEHRSSGGWSTMCSVWQSAVMVFCIAITLIFTAFDRDPIAEMMPRCSILLAVREKELVFLLITLLICTHAGAVVLVSVSSTGYVNGPTRAAYLTSSIRDLIISETLLWQTTLLSAGCVLLYHYVVIESCLPCTFILLELLFTLLPLVLAFAHPFFSIWYILPIRDAIVDVWPTLASILPEYALVPPPPVCEHPTPMNTTTEAHNTQVSGNGQTSAEKVTKEFPRVQSNKPKPRIKKTTIILDSSLDI